MEDKGASGGSGGASRHNVATQGDMGRPQAPHTVHKQSPAHMPQTVTLAIIFPLAFAVFSGVAALASVAFLLLEASGVAALAS